MFDIQKNKSMKNVIPYVAPKNNMMEHSTSLNNRISFVVGISVFWFKKYWVKLFNLMDIKTTPTFKQFLQAKTPNAEKKNPYYQRCDVKILIAFHNQAMIKQPIYENILVRRSGVDYSLGIQFQNIFVIMDKSKALTMKN